MSHSWRLAGKLRSLRFSLTWRWRFRALIKKSNAYIDFETKKLMYRGAPYCLNCRNPVLEYGSFCKDCDNQETRLPRVPYDDKVS